MSKASKVQACVLEFINNSFIINEEPDMSECVSYSVKGVVDFLWKNYSITSLEDEKVKKVDFVKQCKEYCELNVSNKSSNAKKSSNVKKSSVDNEMIDMSNVKKLSVNNEIDTSGCEWWGTLKCLPNDTSFMGVAKNTGEMVLDSEWTMEYSFKIDDTICSVYQLKGGEEWEFGYDGEWTDKILEYFEFEETLEELECGCECVECECVESEQVDLDEMDSESLIYEELDESILDDLEF